MIKIIATQTTGRALKPGDLFSLASPKYWDGVDEQQSIGELVYIRTNTPADKAVDADKPIYLITIEQLPTP